MSRGIARCSWPAAAAAKPPETAKEEAAAPASAPPRAIDEANAATVTGKVSFTGDEARDEDHRHVGQRPPAPARMPARRRSREEVVVNDNGTLKNVFVWVKAGLPDQPVARAGYAGETRSRRAACTGRT